jgi:hypothetical protein
MREDELLGSMRRLDRNDASRQLFFYSSNLKGAGSNRHFFYFQSVTHPLCRLRKPAPKGVFQPALNPFSVVVRVHDVSHWAKYSEQTYSSSIWPSLMAGEGIIAGLHRRILPKSSLALPSRLCPYAASSEPSW